MSPELAAKLACPVHKTALAERLSCAQCGREYPSANGIPVLINDANSVFSTADYLEQRGYGGASAYAGHLDQRRGLRQWYRRAMVRLAEAEPLRDFDLAAAVADIQRQRPDAEILVIGSGDTALSGRVTYSDVAFGAHVQCIADAHDLPFLPRSFDACVAVAVLEHVADPYRCVAEIMRVLRPGGFVYAETPFLQPVHMGAHDFTRFTHLGHRRLFRHFQEIRSGVAGGPGVSAALALRYALTSLSNRPAWRKWLRLAGMLLAFPLRGLDRLAFGSPGAYDSASAFYFYGSLADRPITDRELLALYRGGD